MKILNLENVIPEMKNSADELNSLQDNAEQKLSEHDGETVETIQTERREKNVKNKKKNNNNKKTRLPYPVEGYQEV